MFSSNKLAIDLQGVVMDAHSHGLSFYYEHESVCIGRSVTLPQGRKSNPKGQNIYSPEFRGYLGTNTGTSAICKRPPHHIHNTRVPCPQDVAGFQLACIKQILGNELHL
jgi:hypothetical protein